MSDIKYGLISRTDSDTLERTIDFICDEFKEGINILEVGCYGGDTAKGLVEYLEFKGRVSFITGIDNGKDEETVRFNYDRFIQGNSNEVYNQIEGCSQHMVIIDGNHSLPYVISDYYCYKNKVKKGGFLCFHDASPQAQGQDWQRMGDKGDKDMRISVLKALKEVGIWENKRWKTTFHMWDEDDRCGGFAIFKKMYR